MNDQRTSYGAEDKHSFGTTDLCLDSNHLYCEKNWIQTLALVILMASGLTGRLTDNRFEMFNKIIYRLN